MSAIVTSTYRYKRPPRKRNAVALEVPAIVRRKRSDDTTDKAHQTAPAPPANEARKSAITTNKRPGNRFADVPDMTPEEHKRRGDLADAIMRRLVGKDRP